MKDHTIYSIVAPVYNEIESVEAFYKEVVLVLDKLNEQWELLLVDDGSTDGSTEKIRELAEKDVRVKPVIFARNFGRQIAVTAGLDYSSGDAVVIIDADLQDPPEVIHDLIEKWQDGFQVVYAVRRKREGESAFKLATASLFYRMIYKITDVNIPLDTGDFRLLDRKVVDVMGKMRERHRFLRGMASWVGFKQVGVEYDRQIRRQDEIPIQKNAAVGTERDHRLFLFPAAIGNLYRIYISQHQYISDTCGRIFTPFKPGSPAWASNNTYCRAVPGGRPIGDIRYFGRIYWPNL